MVVKVFSDEYLVFIGYLSTNAIKKYQQCGFICEKVGA